MSTVKLNIAAALLLAIWNFHSTEGPILIDVVEPEANRFNQIRLVRGGEGFRILSRDEGEWIVEGEIGWDASEPSIAHFGGRGVSPPLEMREFFRAFDALSDRTQADVSFEIEIEDQIIRLRQIRSEDLLILLDPEANGAFIIHSGE